MRRFYQDASSAAASGGFVVLLDGKPVRTPAKVPLVLPTAALGAAIATEWQAQGQEVRPPALPLTRLASTAIDLVATRRGAVVEELVKYAGTDLLCYRAEHPPELARRQQVQWQPLLDWAAERFGAPLAVTAGIVPRDQDADTLAAFRRAVEAFDSMRLAALHLATAACGSLVLGLALIEGRLDSAAAFECAQLEESFEIERWGEDSEQTARRAALKDDIALAARFVALAAA